MDRDFPSIVYKNRRFLGVALGPPDFKPGSWIGAGKAIWDANEGRYVLTARPRKAEGGVRGYAADIFLSSDGLHFEKRSGVSKEEVEKLCEFRIHSIEGTQLLRNPENDQWHFYLSVDTGDDFVWGGIKWETVLLTARSLEGPWRSQGKVLRNGRSYDSRQARDGSIDLVGGTWLCVYKAKDEHQHERPALAASSDGLKFQKLGPLTIDGVDHLAFLSGSIFAGEKRPIFMGMHTELRDSRHRDPGVVYADEHGVGHGGGSRSRFVAYEIDRSRMSLESLFGEEWIPLSEFEHPEHPLLGYASLLDDQDAGRMLIYLESIDPTFTRAIGLNETVERTIVYESRYRNAGSGK